MRSHERWIHSVLMLSCFAWGCAQTQVPSDWLPSPKDAREDVYGGWLHLEYSTDRTEKAELAGELIAITADSVFVANDRFHALALANVREARLVVYRSNAAGMGGLVFLGSVTTISNGAYGAITLPMWIIGGSAATGSRSFEPVIDYPKREWRILSLFARYPQGLPAGIDRDRIRMKPANRMED